MNHSDEKFQEKNARYSATLAQNKLLLEINDNVTYIGEIESTPYFNLKELKTIFQSGKVEILSKTTSKLSVKLGYLNVQLQSEEYRHLQYLKKKIKELEDQIKAKSQWIEEDLNSTAHFDTDCIYKINTASGSATSTFVSNTTIGFYLNGHGTTSSTNRKNHTVWGTITKMMKYKV